MVGTSKPRAGSKNSKNVPFEDIDLTLLDDNDKAVSFLTDELSVPLWIESVNEFYKAQKSTQENIASDAVWNQVSSQHKIYAQVKESEYNQNGGKPNQLTISFYYSSYRILIQGNSCKKWCANIFPRIKSMVGSIRSANHHLTLAEVLKDIIVESQVEPLQQGESVKESEIRTPERSTVLITPRRLLPTPPVESNKIETLSKIIKRLEEENSELKEEVHELRMLITETKRENDKHVEAFALLQQEVTEVKSVLSKQIKDSVEEVNSKQRVLDTDLDEIQDMMKEKFDSDEEWKTNITKQIQEQNTDIKDVLQEMNKIQESLFDGDTVQRRPRQSNANESNIEEPSIETEEDQTRSSAHVQPNNKVFRDMKGRSLIFGDSNTKGLDPKKLKMKIGSISGATLESSINHLRETAREKDTVPEFIIYHLGTNDLLNNSDAAIMKQKINTIYELSETKYPKAMIGFCQIPGLQSVPEDKIRDINQHINDHEHITLITNTIHESDFTMDKLHYNNRGLARLAMSIKGWAKDNGFIPTNRRRPTPEGMTRRRPDNAFNHGAQQHRSPTFFDRRDEQRPYNNDNDKYHSYDYGDYNRANYNYNQYDYNYRFRPTYY